MSFATKRSWGRLLAGVLVLSLGLACVLVTAFFLLRDVSIWILGRSVEAEVVDLWLNQTNEAAEGELTFEYYVRYRFTTSNGRTITRDSPVSGIEWSGLSPGSRVDVRYFPLYPQHNRLDDSRFVPILACAYVPVVLICGLIVAGGWHLIQTGLFRSKGRSLREILELDA